MATYSVRGFTVATQNANEAIATLWNPSSTNAVTVDEVWVYRTGITGDRLYINSITARGTPGSTVTPTSVNCWDDPAAPPSGILLDLARFTVQPTESAPVLWGIAGAGATGIAGTGFAWTWPRGIKVAPGRGIGVFVGTAADWPASEVAFVWSESR